MTPIRPTTVTRPTTILTTIALLTAIAAPSAASLGTPPPPLPVAAIDDGVQNCLGLAAVDVDEALTCLQRRCPGEACGRAQRAAGILLRARRHVLPVERARGPGTAGATGAALDLRGVPAAAIDSGLVETSATAAALGASVAFAATAGVLSAARTPTAEAALWVLAMPTLGGLAGGVAGGFLHSSGALTSSTARTAASSALALGTAAFGLQLALFDGAVDHQVAPLRFFAVGGGLLLGGGVGLLGGPRLHLDDGDIALATSALVWGTALGAAGAVVVANLAAMERPLPFIALSSVATGGAAWALTLGAHPWLAQRRWASWVLDASVFVGGLVGTALAVGVVPSVNELSIATGLGVGMAAGVGVGLLAVAQMPSSSGPRGAAQSSTASDHGAPRLTVSALSTSTGPAPAVLLVGQW